MIGRSPVFSWRAGWLTTHRPLSPVAVTAHAPDLLLLCLLAFGAECPQGAAFDEEGIPKGRVAASHEQMGDAFISDCESIEFHSVQCCELVMLER